MLAKICGDRMENGFLFSPEGAQHISPGQVQRRQPRSAALGLVVYGEKP
jgi:hypothetical protein